ncbi:MAG TPA: SH3 domain-containing protein, partial [Longimicrobium sp.]
MSSKITANPHLNVRSGPGELFRIIGNLTTGAEVEVVESNPAGGPWVFVRPGEGWVHGGYLAPAPDGVTPPTKKAASSVKKPKWRTAKSLLKLLEQVNAMAPGRGKKFDGTIGDTSHIKRGKSDHNPNKDGIVTALDITHDPDDGCDCGKIAAALAASRDPRIKYIIYDSRIMSSKVSPWTWRPYTG